MSTKNTVGIYTLGCKVNQYESRAIAEELERLGFELCPPSRRCDAYVINTCTVTAESDRKARQFIRRAIGNNPNAAIVVTGCMAQTAAEAVAAIEGVDAVIGNANKMTCAKMIQRITETGKPQRPIIQVSPIDDAPFEKMNITAFERTRAYVKIEDGCENRCTYCIIPSARGKVRSKEPDEVIAEVSALTAGGCREVVLTGIETASYGKDLDGIDLSSILCRIDKLPNIGRIRLGSLDPSMIKPPMAESLASLEHLAPHFHLSLQSGSDRVLAAMKRKYNSAMAMRAIELLREKIPNVKFTTDVIVGFPGETEEDFQATAEFLRRAGFLRVHIFPYSKRAGTPAAVMKGQIPKEEKTRRLHVLSEIESAIRAEMLSGEIQNDPVKQVLFETWRDGVATGHTPDFLEVSVKSPAPLHAKIRSVRVTHTDGERLFGELTDEK